MKAELRPLSPAEWKGKELEFSYVTEEVYQVVTSGWKVEFRRRPLPVPVRRSFRDTLFGDWLEAPVCFGAYLDGTLAGIVEGSPESWNRRFRVSNLLVFPPFRRMGLGRMLLEHMVEVGRKQGARMAVLETQTCNTGAIDLYQSCGFQLIGFDLYAYSNEDPENNEVRVELGKIL